MAGALATVQWQARGQAPDGRLQPARWGLAAAAGQPLRLGVRLVNQVNREHETRMNTKRCEAM